MFGYNIVTLLESHIQFLCIFYWKVVKITIFTKSKKKSLFSKSRLWMLISSNNVSDPIARWAVRIFLEFRGNLMIFRHPIQRSIFTNFAKKQHFQPTSPISGYHIATLGTICCQKCQPTSGLFRSQILSRNFYQNGFYCRLRAQSGGKGSTLGYHFSNRCCYRGTTVLLIPKYTIQRQKSSVY